MSILIIFGNKNKFTFGNSVVAANHKSIDLFNSCIEDIHIICSKDSRIDLNDESLLDYLEINNINIEKFVGHKIIDFSDNEKSIKDFVLYIEKIIKGADGIEKIIVDHTNGTTFQKHILSIATYILDIKYQYVIDTTILANLTDERGFINATTLNSAYIAIPENKYLDNLAYLSLTELNRYRQIIKSYTKKFSSINNIIADSDFFEDNLIKSIEIKLKNDISKSNTGYRISTSSLSSSIEEVLSLILNRFTDSSNKKWTLGEKIWRIRSYIEDKDNSDFDMEFLNQFNNFILYLRNSSVHKKGILNDIERFKADLSVKMIFPFIEFYIDIILPILNEESNDFNSMKFNYIEAIPSQNDLYYGLDGDNTGSILEHLFLSDSEEKNFKEMSQSVTNSINSIKKYITDKNRGQIVFAAGDDILFKGNFSIKQLEDLQSLYRNKTKGLTCSIGFGHSFQEVYIALKIAKARPGKNSIIGIDLHRSSSKSSHNGS